MSRLKIKVKRSRVEHQLDALYATLPKIECKRLCHRACSALLMTDTEAERIAKVTRTLPIYDVERQCCNKLTEDHRCSCYSVRPAVCRLWGLIPSPEMACPFGCIPERWMTKEDEWVFLMALGEITGEEISTYFTVQEEDFEAFQKQVADLITAASAEAQEWESAQVDESRVGSLPPVGPQVEGISGPTAQGEEA